MSGSVGQPNFDDLDKFLVSLGLVAVVGSGAVPWLLYRGSEDLRLSQADFAELRPAAQEVIRTRQSWFEITSILTPWLSALLFVFGLLAVLKGYSGWRRRQSEADSRESTAAEREKVALKMEQANLKNLTAEEKEEELEAEAAEAVAQTIEIGSPRLSRAELHNEFMERLRTVEQAVTGALVPVTPPTHRLLSQVRVGRSEGRVKFDVLVQSERGFGNDVAVDIRLVVSAGATLRAVKDFASEMAAYEPIRPTSVLTVLVTPEAWDPNRIERITSRAEAFYAKLGIRTKVDIVSEAALSTYRPGLRDLI